MHIFFPTQLRMEAFHRYLDESMFSNNQVLTRFLLGTELHSNMQFGFFFYLVWDAIIKRHRVRRFKTEMYFLIILESDSSAVRVTIWLGPGKGPLPGL